MPHSEPDYPIDCYDRYQYDQKHYDENVRRIPQRHGSDDVILPKNDSHVQTRKLLRVTGRSCVLLRLNRAASKMEETGRVLGCHSLQLKNLNTLTEKCQATSRS
jgi:hypothetical protein